MSDADLLFLDQVVEPVFVKLSHSEKQLLQNIKEWEKGWENITDNQGKVLIGFQLLHTILRACLHWWTLFPSKTLSYVQSLIVSFNTS